MVGAFPAAACGCCGVNRPARIPLRAAAGVQVCSVITGRWAWGGVVSVPQLLKLGGTVGKARERVCGTCGRRGWGAVPPCLCLFLLCQGLNVDAGKRLRIYLRFTRGLELKESLWAGLSKARVCWRRLRTFLLLLSELLPAAPLCPRVNSKPAGPKCCRGEINHLCLCFLSAG